MNKNHSERAIKIKHTNRFQMESNASLLIIKNDDETAEQKLANTIAINLARNAHLEIVRYLMRVGRTYYNSNDEQ